VNSVLCHATMQIDGLYTSRNNANTLVAISMVMRAVIQHYYVRNNVHVEDRFYSYELLQRTDRSVDRWSQCSPVQRGPVGGVSCEARKL
jgi:hypothetical protein